VNEAEKEGPQKNRSRNAAEERQLSECVSLSESCLQEALSEVLQEEMKAAYGDLWTEVPLHSLQPMIVHSCKCYMKLIFKAASHSCKCICLFRLRFFFLTFICCSPILCDLYLFVNADRVREASMESGWAAEVF